MRGSQGSAVCRSCRSEDCNRLFDCDRGVIHRCQHCGTYFVNENGTPDPGLKRQFYSTIDKDVYCDYFEPFRTAQYDYVLRKANIAPGRSLLDIGASYGWLLQVALRLGLDAYGIEPGETNLGPPLESRIVRESLAEYHSRAGRRFDVVTMWHVLEHLPDPVAAVRQVKNLLSPGGLFVITGPSADGYLFQLAVLLRRFGIRGLLDDAFYLHNPSFHYFMPSERSLRDLLETAGFEVCWTEPLDGVDWAGFWKRTRSSFPRAIARSVGPLLRLSRFTAKDNLIVVASAR